MVNLTFIKNKSHRDSLKRPNKLDVKLEDLEINQSLRWNEREKPRPTVENDPGSW